MPLYSEPQRPYPADAPLTPFVCAPKPHSTSPKPVNNYLITFSFFRYTVLLPLWGSGIDILRKQATHIVNHLNPIS